MPSLSKFLTDQTALNDTLLHNCLMYRLSTHDGLYIMLASKVKNISGRIETYSLSMMQSVKCASPMVTAIATSTGDSPMLATGSRVSRSTIPR